MALGIANDFRSGWRLLTRRPGVAAVAIFSLALGIGANVTIFSLARAVVLRAPAVANPGRLAEVYTHDLTPNAPLNGFIPISYPDYLDFQQQNQVFSGMTAYAFGEATFRPVHGGQTSVMDQTVSGSYFSVLGVAPALGRGFVPEETANGGPRAVVLAYDFWQQHLAGQVNILGRQITLDGEGFTVVGVAPKGFVGLFAGLQPAFWVPAANAGRLGGSFGEESGSTILTDRGARDFFTVGRLRPGVTLQEASANLAAIARRLDAEYPTYDEKTFSGAAVPLSMVPMPFRKEAGGIVVLLMVVVGLILLIACANAANVLLAQATGRRREMAVRAALGASRGRLIRQVLSESLVLALIAGALGVWVATWAGPLLLHMRTGSLPISINVQPDGASLLFAFALAVVTGLIFGMAPALRASRVRLVERLQEGSSRVSAGRSRLRAALVIGEVAVCAVVLVGAGLCLRSLGQANSVNPGFDAGHLLVVQNVNPRALGYSGTRAQSFMQQMLTTAQNTPGITAAGWVTTPPLQASESDTEMNFPGLAPPPGHHGYDVETTPVSPGFFAAMGIPVLRGRLFTQADLAHPNGLVVVNQAMAARFWPGQDPIGKEVIFADRKNAQASVIGVVPTGKYTSLNERPHWYFYQLQPFNATASLMMRTAGAPTSVLATVGQRLEAVDPDLDTVQTGTQFLGVALFPAHVTAILLGAFGVLALALAVVGLYGVMAYSVSQRTWEFGVRLTLGASPGSLAGAVVGQGLKVALVGIVIGVGLALALSKSMAGMLYGIQPTDPVTYIAVAALLAGITVLACYWPARRASRVDPALTLRLE